MIPLEERTGLIFRIPENLETIKVSEYAARGFWEIDILENVIKIERYAFATNNLSQIYIPKNVKEVSDIAFFSNPLKVIYGHNGTAAEEFAKRNNYEFIAV